MRFGSILLALAAAGGCGGSAPPTVLVAASLDRAVGAILAATDGGPVARSAAATSVLARQVEQGLGADVLLSADRRWVDYLTDRDLGVEASEFARNVLVAWVRRDAPAPAGREALAEARFRPVAVGDEAVPVGRYARAAIALPSDALLPCRDAPAVVAAVRSGEAAVGLAYRTDGAGDPELREAFAFDRPDDPPVVYWAVLLRERPEARTLLARLRGPEARAVLDGLGFR